MRQLCISGLVFISLVPFAMAGTLEVGPGAPFSTPQAAVAAALPGDTILVHPGTYSTTGGLVIDKALTLIGAGSDLVTLRAIPSGAFFSEPAGLVVQNLLPGESVRVVGLELTSQLSGGSLGTISLLTFNCQGSVSFADLVGTTGSGTFSVTTGSCIVRDCEDVSMDGCSFKAAAGVARALPGTSSGLIGQAGLYVENSNVHVNHCVIAGADGDALPFGPFLPEIQGGAGILTLSSTVRLSRSLISGGRGGIDVTNDSAESGGAALEGEASSFFVRGGAGNLLAGGIGGFVTSTGTSAAGASGIQMDPGSEATTAKDVVLIPGPDGDGTLQAPAVSGQGTYLPLGENLSTIATSTSLAGLGDLVTVELGGEPGSIDIAFFGFDSAGPMAIAGISGLLMADPAQLVKLVPLTLDANGVASHPILLPTQAAFVGRSALFQGLAISPTGFASFSAPSILAIF